MGLLAPWFLAASLTLALPLWLHRLRTQSAEREKFSSTMLLETTEQRVHVRRRLRYLILLALRIALLALVALAFAQPFVERPPRQGLTGQNGSSFVVVDGSASMGRSGVFSQALAEVASIVDSAPAGVALQVALAAGPLRLLHEPSADRAVARRALNGIEPLPLRLDVGQLAREIGLHAASLPQPVTLHLVSDFQASAMPARFADAIPPGIARLEPHPVGTGLPVNWAVAFVRRAAHGVEVGAHAWGLTDGTADVELIINGESRGIRSITGSGPHLASFDAIELLEGENRVLVTVTANDDLDIDDRFHAVIANDPPSPVPLLTANAGGLAATYLSAALESGGEKNFEVKPMPLAEFDSRVLGRYRWAIVDDLLQLDSRLQGALREYIAGGGNLLAFGGPDGAVLDTLPIGGQRIAPAVLASRPDEFLSVGGIDARHPVLARTEGWHRLNVGQRLRVETAPHDRVLVRLDDDSPYIIEQRIGSGLLLTVLDALDNRASDLPVHPVFVGLVLEAANHLEGRATRMTNLVAGDSLLPGAGGGQIVAPDGSTLLALEATLRPRPVRLEAPGIYEVYAGDEVFLVAANVDPRESDLDPIDQEALELWRDSTHTAIAAATDGPTFAGPTRLELWPSLLLALLLVAIAESMLANHHLASRMGVSG
ncbi:MAG: BatA and WFA domain-containing protein [Gammaproteobacteria bacterium]|nr:BatA and WFA domain-containing protein [Gammaproteobacteria bacterium]